jgi:hypothetical protein
MIYLRAGFQKKSYLNHGKAPMSPRQTMFSAFQRDDTNQKGVFLPEFLDVKQNRMQGEKIKLSNVNARLL